MMLGLQRLRCRRVRHSLWDYVAQRLSEGTLETVERHLSACSSCRREAESMRNAQGVLAAYRQEAIPAPPVRLACTPGTAADRDACCAASSRGIPPAPARADAPI